MAKKSERVSSAWAQLYGRWRIANNALTYVGPTNQQTPFGLCLSSASLRSGVVRAKTKLMGSGDVASRIVFGYRASTENYYSVGLGGNDAAYILVAFTQGRGWQPIDIRGTQSQLEKDRIYDLEVRLLGQNVWLTVDGVRVLQAILPSPIQSDQIGLFAWGAAQVEFTNFQSEADEPKVFVVMQFGEPYDSLYREVIKSICSKKGFAAFRGDDVFKPGIILQDIRRGIIDSDVIIAEITPVNANVFYELGFAHALDKPTILLATRNVEKLPFDISGYRVIFYDDTIGGKSDVEATLAKHLENIRRGER